MGFLVSAQTSQTGGAVHAMMIGAACWHNNINGAVISVTKGPKGSARKLVEALEKQPCVGSAELDNSVTLDTVSGLG
jgi:hypothetical protein